MNRVEVTWGKTIRVWWSFVWRCALFSGLLAFALGFIGGFVIGIIGRPELGGVVGGILGYLASIPVSIYVLKKILEKKYSDFSVALVTDQNSYGKPKTSNTSIEINKPSKVIKVETLSEQPYTEELTTTTKHKPPTPLDVDCDPRDISTIDQKILDIESSPLPVTPLNINIDKIYEKALNEIEDNKLHKPSWARAFSESGGEKNKAEALYVKLRVANIKDKLHQEEKKRQAEARRIQDLQEQKLRCLQTAKKKEKVLEELEEKWSNLLHRHEKVLAAYDLTDYIYDITKVTPSHKRIDFAKWLMFCDSCWFSRTISAGPSKSAFGHYGIILLVALEKGIDIQGAKKWGRPSRFEVLDNQ